MTATAGIEEGRRELVDFVLDTVGSPTDRREVVATLETRGMRDVDAAERFGALDLFDLGDDVYERCRRRLVAEPPSEEAEDVTTWYGAVAHFFLLYGRGLFFALPTVVQLLTIVALRLSGRLTDAQATIVAVGTILSFIAAGGFMQTIGRLGLIHSVRENYHLVPRICYRLITLGLISTLAVGLLFCASSIAFGLFPAGELPIALTYEFLLSFLWLSLAVLYMLERRVDVLAMTVLWVSILALLLRFTTLDTYVAHWLAIGVTALVTFLWGRRRLRVLERATPIERREAKLPPRHVLAASVAPYFAFGVLYFSYLFLDRMVAWLGEGPESYAVFFQRPYELGMNWALLSLVLTVAVLDYAIHSFAEQIIPAQKRIPAARLADHNRYFQRVYARQLLLFTGVACVSALIAYQGMLWLRDFDDTRFVREFFGDTVTYKVVAWAILGYALMVWGLLNSVLFFFLSQPKFVLRSMAPALLVSAVCGLVLSTTGAYWHSVIGLAVGSFVFALLSTRYAIRLLNDLDYYYYSAY